jgi:hypothetical protein
MGRFPRDFELGRGVLLSHLLLQPGHFNMGETASREVLDHQYRGKEGIQFFRLESLVVRRSKGVGDGLRRRLVLESLKVLYYAWWL